jgi:hypothetical protein
LTGLPVHYTQTDGVSRRANYRRLFDTGIDLNLVAEIRTATNGNYALGNERFKAEVSLMLQRRVTPGKAGRPTKPDVGRNKRSALRRMQHATYGAMRLRLIAPYATWHCFAWRHWMRQTASTT